MRLVTKAGYETALVQKHIALSVSSLQTKAADIRASVTAKGLRPQDCVIVYLADTIDIMCAAWALISSNITGAYIKAPEQEAFIPDILRRNNTIHVITERKYVSLFHTLSVICIDEALDMTAYTGAAEAAAGESDKLFVFYNAVQDSLYEQLYSKNDIENFFSQLDTIVDTTANKRIMLSASISFSRLIMELIWASSRGITVVMADAGEAAAVYPYIPVTSNFNMEFGLFYFGSYVETAEKNRYNLLFDTVSFADKHGFKAVWTPERHFNEFGGLYPNPSVLSAALAVTTANVQIRSGSLVAPLHHPVRIAEDWALVDNLSNGRAAVSFASGWQCDDFIFFPENYPDRHNHMIDQINKVQQLWAGKKMSFKNGLGKETNIAIFPKPIQKTLPVWITVSGRIETFIDAGKIGANILTHLLWQDSGELVEKIAAYRKSLKESGFNPRAGKVSIMVHTYLGSSNETVKEKVRKPLTSYIRSSTQLIQAMIKSNAEATHAKDVGGRYGDVNSDVPEKLLNELADIAFERFYEQAALLGTIEKGKKLINRLKEYDVDEIACLIDFGLCREDIMEGLAYLEQLKNEYARNPVQVTHCSLNDIEESKSNADLVDYLSAQQLLLVDANSFEQIPAHLLHKTAIIIKNKQPDEKDPLRLMKYSSSEHTFNELFNTAVAEDF